MKLKYSKVRNVKSPLRAHSTDAGIDMFVPDISEEKFQSDFPDKNLFENASLLGTTIIIKPHGRVCIPSGVHVNIKPGYALYAANKSGVATKLGLVSGAQLIDEDYQGEVHLSLVNTTNKEVFLKSNQKIIQFIYIPIASDIPEEVPFDELYSEITNRSSGGFGSSGV